MSAATINARLEFTISKEASSIAVTAGEVIAIYQTLCRDIESPAFVDRMNRILAQLEACYRIPVDALQALVSVTTLEQFKQQFETLHTEYSANYLNYASMPRRYVDAAYEQYLELSMGKEAATTYPVLRRAFDRFFQYIDKWINNDSWLIMSMDTLFKMTHRLLGEVATLKARDLDDAWWMYQSAMANLEPFLVLVHNRCEVMASACGGAGASQAGAAA